MTLLVLPQDGDGLYRDLGGIPEVHYDIGMGLDAVAAITAAQYGTWQDISFSKDRPRIKFLHELAAASGAYKSVVESISFLDCWGEHVSVTFNESPRYLGVHLF